MISLKVVEYREGDTTLEGYLGSDDGVSGNYQVCWLSMIGGEWGLM